MDFGGGGSEESSTDDDGGVGGDVGIDMRKLLSSSSQAGGDCGGGPDLSRQLMTHLRLLQADLQYLKVERRRISRQDVKFSTEMLTVVVAICFQEVELKYDELRCTHGDPAAPADVDDNNSSFGASDQTVD